MANFCQEALKSLGSYTRGFTVLILLVRFSFESSGQLFTGAILSEVREVTVIRTGYKLSFAIL